jgi:hypothetical protein
MRNPIIFMSLLTLLVLGFWLYARAKAASKNTTSHHDIEPFHNVCIQPGKKACAHVKALKGNHFLAREVSPLPLKDCNAKSCSCRYIHYKDRRDGEDRRYPSGVMASVYADKEQLLKQGGRRKHDSI